MVKRFLSNYIRSELHERGNIIEVMNKAEVTRSFISKLHPKGISRPLIRVGGTYDGGYLLPDDLDDIAGVISPGTANECSFDLAFANKGVPIYMVDASVDGPPQQHKMFNFQKKFLETYSDDQNITLTELIQHTNTRPDQDLLLQIDIEGAEYRTILNTPIEMMKRFRIISIEFHGLYGLAQKTQLPLIWPTFEHLLRTHEVVHAHPNNCFPVRYFNGVGIPDLMEFTFYRKDRDSFTAPPPTVFPNPLDADNVLVRPTVVLPRDWYAAAR
jgi:hypothetical protein